MDDDDVNKLAFNATADKLTISKFSGIMYVRQNTLYIIQ